MLNFLYFLPYSLYQWVVVLVVAVAMERLFSGEGNFVLLFLFCSQFYDRRIGNGQ